MNEKPEALRLADECDWSAKFKAAKELRRLHAENERLREALKLALNSHGRMLMSDPPQDAWKFNRVDEVINAALRREETT